MATGFLNGKKQFLKLNCILAKVLYIQENIGRIKLEYSKIFNATR